MRALSVILIIAFLVQATSLRACVIEKVVTGSNCHDGDVVARDHSSSGINVSAPLGCPDHTETCVCKTERNPSSEHKQIGPVFDVFRCVTFAWIPILNPASHTAAPNVIDRAFDLLPVNLPLLI